MNERTPVNNKSGAISQIAKVVNGAVSEERRCRDRLMGDRRMRYAYSSMDGVLHDRECRLVADISDRHFHMLTDFCAEMAHCPECTYKALVRSAIGDDIRHIDAYVGVLKRLGAKMINLQELILVNKARFYGVGINHLYIEVHEDRWIICREEDGLALYHNNYEVLETYERLFREGFHLQYDNYNCSFGYYVNCMCGYSWEDHVKRLRAKDLETKKIIFRVQLAIANNTMRLKRRSLFFNHYKILSWGDEARECCEKEGVYLKVLGKRC